MQMIEKPARLACLFAFLFILECFVFLEKSEAYHTIAVDGPVDGDVKEGFLEDVRKQPWSDDPQRDMEEMESRREASVMRWDENHLELLALWQAQMEVERMLKELKMIEKDIENHGDEGVEIGRE